MTTIDDLAIKYLKQKNISINQPEFQFQYQSHPDYPSLLALVDTLTFFDVDSQAFNASFEYINALPTQFIALLSQENSEPELQLLEKRGTAFFIFNNNKIEKIETQKLQEKWQNVVLTVNNANTVSENSKKPIVTIGFVVLSLFLIGILVISKATLFEKLFLVLPVIGLLLSIAALKDIFGTNSKIINSLCNISAATSCSSVVKSSKWKIFEIVNFSDLSITFFASQLLVLFTSIIFIQSADVLQFQKLILFLSIPVLLLSVFYQKFIEKKWCPICLLISVIVVVQIIVLHFLETTSISILNQIVLFGFVFFAVYFSWMALKGVLLAKKELKESQIKSNRFEKNYSLFKLKLVNENKIDLPNDVIVLGNKNSKTSITIVTNPNCIYCEEVHKTIEKILLKNKGNIKVNVIIRTNLGLLTDDFKKLFRGLFSIYLNYGESSFLEALNAWFNNNNLSEWAQKYYEENDFTQIDQILQNHLLWTNEKEYTFTPALFINGYEFPKMYDRKNLEYFISEIIEDPDFN